MYLHFLHYGYTYNFANVVELNGIWYGDSIFFCFIKISKKLKNDLPGWGSRLYSSSFYYNYHTIHSSALPCEELLQHNNNIIIVSIQSIILHTI